MDAKKVADVSGGDSQGTEESSHAGAEVVVMFINAGRVLGLRLERGMATGLDTADGPFDADTFLAGSEAVNA